MIWVESWFMTMAGALAFLNKLPEKRALEAKLLSYGRLGGVAVVYRKE